MLNSENDIPLIKSFYNNRFIEVDIDCSIVICEWWLCKDVLTSCHHTYSTHYVRRYSKTHFKARKVSGRKPLFSFFALCSTILLRSLHNYFWQLFLSSSQWRHCAVTRLSKVVKSSKVVEGCQKLSKCKVVADSSFLQGCSYFEMSCTVILLNQGWE